MNPYPAEAKSPQGSAAGLAGCAGIGWLVASEEDPVSRRKSRFFSSNCGSDDAPGGVTEVGARGGAGNLIPPGGGGKNPGVPPMLFRGRALRDGFSP